MQPVDWCIFPMRPAPHSAEFEMAGWARKNEISLNIWVDIRQDYIVLDNGIPKNRDTLL